MFDNNSEVLIHWFENLEETCQKLIFDKSESWFQNSLDKNDVESAFSSVIRIYKSGKYYLVRTNIRIAANNEPSIKIYNENEIPLSIEDVKEDTNIISILEIQGIKFTSRNFQIDIELRQAMVLDSEPLFDNCLIKTSYSHKTNITSEQVVKENNNLHVLSSAILDNTDNILNPDNIVNPDNTDKINPLNDSSKELTGNLETLGTVENSENKLELDLDLGKEYNAYDDIKNNAVKEDLGEIEELEDNSELKEVDLNFSLENDDLESSEGETITLKKPNEVYYELYKAAREKAKQAKKNAIIAYLEAKNIRKTYMIDNLDESDCEIDDEIDEVSESELEGL
jgi:hypothetical protein